MASSYYKLAYAQSRSACVCKSMLTVIVLCIVSGYMVSCFFLHFGHLYINKRMEKILCLLQCKIKNKSHIKPLALVMIYPALFCSAFLPNASKPPEALHVPDSHLSADVQWLVGDRRDFWTFRLPHPRPCSPIPSEQCSLIRQRADRGDHLWTQLLPRGRQWNER